MIIKCFVSGVYTWHITIRTCFDNFGVIERNGDPQKSKQQQKNTHNTNYKKKISFSIYIFLLILTVLQLTPGLQVLWCFFFTILLLFYPITIINLLLFKKIQIFLQWEVNRVAIIFVGDTVASWMTSNKIESIAKKNHCYTSSHTFLYHINYRISWCILQEHHSPLIEREIEYSLRKHHDIVKSFMVNECM